MNKEKSENKSRIRFIKGSRNDNKIKKIESGKKIKKINLNFDNIIKKRDKLILELNTKEKHYELQITEKNKLKAELDKLKLLLDKLTKDLHGKSIEETELRIKKDLIENKIKDLTSISPKKLYKEIINQSISLNFLNEQKKILKNKLNSTENINLNAPEEYEVLIKRINFLSSQS